MDPAKSPDVTILLADDDRFFELGKALEDEGATVIRALTPRQALKELRVRAKEIDAVVLDVLMEMDGLPASKRKEQYPRPAGIVLGKQIRRDYPSMPIVGCSQNTDERAWFERHGQGFIDKGDLHSNWGKAVNTVLDVALRRRPRKPRCFIVHGRDSAALFDLKAYIMDTLRFGAPIVLREQPCEGRTIIEKFESDSERADLVFVLLTPDEVAFCRDEPDRQSLRARQNVIFELGYFFAKLQRTQGKVVLLRKDNVELPSDIAGIVAIDITNGIASVGAAIRKELSQWRQPSGRRVVHRQRQGAASRQRKEGR